MATLPGQEGPPFRAVSPAPPPGGLSRAAMSDRKDMRLLRNYDLSQDLIDGLLLRSEWTGRLVMGMTTILGCVLDICNCVEATLAILDPGCRPIWYREVFAPDLAERELGPEPRAIQRRPIS